MREIGGYMEIEHYHLPMLHDTAIALNSGRNCLSYLLKSKKIKRMLLPYYLCGVIERVCQLHDVVVRHYHVNEFFLPVEMELLDDEWLYIVNYYGQVSRKDIECLYKKYKRIIVDYAQAYFEMPLEGVDSFYTCRKFFGVPDGAFLYTDLILDEMFEEEKSYDKLQYLAGRYECSATEFYEEFQYNEKKFNISIKKMSKLTMNLLHGIDYVRVKNKRTENFRCLEDYLNNLNLLDIKESEGAFAYPFMVKNVETLREELIKSKVYVPILWKDTRLKKNMNRMEECFVYNILPLPCDQRYGVDEMKYICDIIRKNIKL